MLVWFREFPGTSSYATAPAHRGARCTPTPRSLPKKPPTACAIRELFDAYAHCADRRDSEAQKSLFTERTRFAVYMSGEGTEPTYVVEGREALTLIFEDLKQYDATTQVAT